MNDSLLSKENIDSFHRDGLLVLKGFYDVEREILPIQRAIYDLIGLMLDRENLKVDRKPFSAEHFDSGIAEIVCEKRPVAGEIFNLIKLIPAFVRLSSSGKHEEVFKQLRGSDLVGYALGSCGIRMDHPGEDKYSSPWHQEYVGHLRSMDGVAFWSPLLPMSEELGPVRFCVGSHAQGFRRVSAGNPNHPEREQGYSLMICDESKELARYEKRADLLNPGDAVVIDYLTLHASSPNRSNRTRWSLQMRMFNFLNQEAIARKWRGVFPDGGYTPVIPSLKEVHPEFFVQKEESFL